jgi:putative methyltransferase
MEALKAFIEKESRLEEASYPRWIRVNSLSADLEDAIRATFPDFERVLTIEEVMASSGKEKTLYLDQHVPNLIAVSPGTDVTKTTAYRTGDLILQDKASCFPAYLLDPRAEDGDVVDACAAPGNKTTHLASIIKSHCAETESVSQKIFAFEKDSERALTLAKLVELAGAKKMTRIALGQDFLKVDPYASTYAQVGALLLDPSCSGSGIVGRDSMPTLHLAEAMPPPPGPKNEKDVGSGGGSSGGKKRKRDDGGEGSSKTVVLDDDGNPMSGSEQELGARLRALSAFQLKLVLHAFKFPAARKITYSTCSVHAEENEQVVLKALASDIAKERGWRILPREKQVRGMREWPVRGDLAAAEGDTDLADACIRSYRGDGRGVMGFFVVAFERDLDEDKASTGEPDGPFVRDEDGMIVRDLLGMPILKATGEHVSLETAGEPTSEEESEEESDEDEDDEDEDEDGEGEGADQEEGDWHGFDD